MDFSDIQNYLQQRSAPASDASQTIGPSGAPYYVASNQSVGLPDPGGQSSQIMSTDQPDATPDASAVSRKAPVDPLSRLTPQEMGGPSQASDSAPYGVPDLSKYQVTADDYQNAANAKRRDVGLGMIGDALANQQSLGNFMLGKMDQHHDVSSGFNRMAEMEDQPIQAKQALMKQAIQAPQNRLQMIKAAQEAQQMQEMQDPNSTASKLTKSIALGAVSQLEMPAEVKAQLTDAIRSGNAMSVHELVDSNPLLKEQFSATIAGRKLAQQMAMMQQRQDMNTQRLNQGDERIHNQNLAKVVGDPTLTQLNTTANNLKNAITNFQNGGATPQEFNELQQAVRSNAGIKGAGGVGEREETYLKSLGLNKDKFMQFITGDPQSVMKSDPEFAKQILGVANLELQNKQRQANARLDIVTPGHRSFYSRHPDLKGDYDSAVSGVRGAMTAPQDQQQAAPSGQQGANDAMNAPDVQKYAKDHGITPQQALAIKVKRTSQVAGN